MSSRGCCWSIPTIAVAVVLKHLAHLVENDADCTDVKRVALVGSLTDIAEAERLPRARVCCDSSPNRHATRHAGSSGHSVLASAEPGERWLFCCTDEVFAEY